MDVIVHAVAAATGVGLVIMAAHFVLESRMKRSVGGMPFMRSYVPGLGVALQYGKTLAFLERALGNDEYRLAGAFAFNLAGDLTVMVTDPVVLDQVHKGKSTAQLDLLWPKPFHPLIQLKGGFPKEQRAAVMQLASSASCKALHPEILAVFTKHVEAMQRDLQAGEFVDAAVAVPRAVWDFVATVVLGPEVVGSGRADELLRLIMDFGNGFLSVPVAIPGLAFSRAMQARLDLIEIFRAEVHKRETSDGAAHAWASRPDLVQRAINAVRANGGDPCTDVDLQFLVNTTFAMTDTTVWASVRIPQCMADFPSVRAKVSAEVLAVAGSADNLASVSYETLLENMPYTWATVEEVMRFYPVAPVNFRTTFQDIAITTADGRTFPIPRGARVFSAVEAVGRASPDFVDAGEFQPERFMAPRNEQQGKLRTSNMTFGTGPRLCPGMRLAKTELFLFTALLSGLGELKLRDKSESIRFEANPIVQPVHGLFFGLA